MIRSRWSRPGKPLPRPGRYLEVYEVSGRSMTELQQAGAAGCPWDLYQIGIMPEDRAELHRRIEERFRAMLKAGFLDEVAALRRREDLGPDLPSMKAVGYRQVWLHLDGEFDFETMVLRGIAATRQLAKRQLTWLRSWPEARIIGQAELIPVLKILKSGSILS